MIFTDDMFQVRQTVTYISYWGSTVVCHIGGKTINFSKHKAKSALTLNPTLTLCFSDGHAAPICCGTESFEPEQKAFNLPVSYGDELRVVNK